MNHFNHQQEGNRYFKVGGFRRDHNLGSGGPEKSGAEKPPKKPVETPPWELTGEEARQAELQASTKRQAREEVAYKKREAKVIKKELADIDMRASESHDEKRERVRTAQAADMRRREIKLQADLAEVPWYKRGERKRLESTLRIVTDRLNGLTQTTPEMRKFERKAAVVDSVSANVREKGSLSRRENTAAARKAKAEMHVAAKEQEQLGRFSRLFKTRAYREARARTREASRRYAQALKEGAGRVEITETEMAELHHMLDERDQRNAA